MASKNKYVPQAHTYARLETLTYEILWCDGSELVISVPVYSEELPMLHAFLTECDPDGFRLVRISTAHVVEWLTEDEAYGNARCEAADAAMLQNAY